MRRPIASPSTPRLPPPTASGDTTSRDSLLVSAGTALARLTGVARVVVIGAVLGPTTFGNAFQVANSLPNLVYYGFLAGSLISTLLVPTMVRHLVAHEPAELELVARRFLGLVLAGTAVAAPMLVGLLPRVVASTSGSDPANADLVPLVTALVAMTAPQVALYAVAGTGAAVMYAHRRFALPACAPAVENVVLIAVFAVAATVYGTGREGAEVPTSELLLLGLGSTAAVAVHAAMQWWGARRCGVRLLPARGWTDPALRAVVRRARHSLLQAGLLALQTVALLVAMTRVPGGVVTFQIALNFYFLPVALVVTPIGIGALPRLAELHHGGDSADATGYWEAYVRAVRLALFLVVPATAGYVVLAGSLAHVVGVGALSRPDDHRMIAATLAVLSLGLVGHALFFVSTQAAYARDDSVRPLRSMALQAAVCLVGVVLAVLVADADALAPAVAAAYAIGCLAGGTHLATTLARGAQQGYAGWLRPLPRVLAGSAVTAAAVLGLTRVAGEVAPGRLGAVLVVLVGGLAGAAVYAATQALLRAPELAWLREAVRRPVAANGTGA
jgi:putative peptidoglycan lipid II flippase